MFNIKKLLTKILSELHILDSRPYVIDQGESATHCFYRKWSDGTLEQWGNYSVPATAGNGRVTVPLAIDYIDTDYIVTLSRNSNAAGDVTVLGEFDYTNKNRNRTVNSFMVSALKTGFAYAIYFGFYTIGKWE